MLLTVFYFKSCHWCCREMMEILLFKHGILKYTRFWYVENSRQGVSIFKAINLGKFNQITFKNFFSKIHYQMEIQRQCHGHLQKWVNKFQFCLLFIENVYFFFNLAFASQIFTSYRTTEEEEGLFLTPPYHFHPFHRHSEISQVMTAESSTLHTASDCSRTGNPWLLIPSWTHILG